MRKSICLIAFMLVSGLVFSSMGTPAWAQKQKVFKWKLQCDFSPGDYQLEQCTYRFAKELKKQTKGKIDIAVFSQGQLVSPKESLEALSNGLFQVRTSCAAYERGKIPWADVEFGLPLAFRNKTDWYRCWFQYGMLNFMRENYAKRWNVFYVCPNPFPGGALLSTKPVKRLEDIRGMKIRAIGAVARTWQKLGAAPVSVSSKELYTALTTGVVDGVVYSSMTIESMKLYEVAKYYLLPPVPNIMGGHMLVNRDAWNKLPDNLKNIFLETAWEHSHCAVDVPEEWAKGWLEKAKKYGISVNKLSDADLRKIRKLCKPVWDKVEASNPLAAKAIQIIRDTQKGEGYNGM